MSPIPFVQLPLEVLGRGDLEPSVRLVYAALLLHARGGAVCYPSETTLASDAGVSERSVRRALDRLVQETWLELEVLAKRRRRYRILGPRVAGPAPPASGGPAKSPPRAGIPAKLPASLAGDAASLAGIPGATGQNGSAEPANLAAKEHGLKKTKADGHERRIPGDRVTDVPNTEGARARTTDRARVLWSALSTALPGGAPHPHNLPGCRAWDEGIAALIAEDVTAAELPGLVATYRARMPRVECTPRALAAHTPALRVDRPAPTGGDRFVDEIAIARARIDGGRR